MINKLYIYTTDCTDPYENLALEEVLLSNVEADACILYLWQNQHTVVIGRNQNPWAECRTAILQAEGGHLARRLSGGGAVYHDLGNLNFTFLCSDENYDLNRQLSVIQKAVAMAGIEASFSGRNDLLAQGAKFSGNAFYHSKGKAYHHGTLLIDVDFSKLERYLSPPKAKLQAKGIASVRSRVINLRELSPTLTNQDMKACMAQAFAKVYGMDAQPLILTHEKFQEVAELAQKYRSQEWLYGKQISFSCNLEGRLSFGCLQLQIQVEGGHISDLLVYTDAMDITISEEIRNTLLNCAFQQHAMTDRLSSCRYSEELKDFIIAQDL